MPKGMFTQGVSILLERAAALDDVASALRELVIRNSQLDIPDAECCFHSASYDFNEVDNFARNVSLYLLQHGEVINTGDTMDVPGGIRWQAEQRENGICEPPRPVLRWRPQDNRRPPDVILNSEESS